MGRVLAMIAHLYEVEKLSRQNGCAGSPCNWYGNGTLARCSINCTIIC
jgi:hypothetical protein